MENRLYLLVHTMTIADYNFVIQAQFFHTYVEGLAHDARLIGRRVSMRLHPALRRDSAKAVLKRLRAPSVKGAVKVRGSAVVKHHLRRVHIGPEFVKSSALNLDNSLSQHGLIPQKGFCTNGPQSPDKKDESTNDSIGTESFNNNHLNQFSNPNETVHWLTVNRFEKYLDVFNRFSGSDMLRMSRDDMIQICGQADGIRLHNALHLRAIAPKLKLYICRENMSVFNAVFLSSHSHMELLQKLCSMMSVRIEQVKAVYVEGPQAIHVQLNDDFLRHVESETMFSLSVLQENGMNIFVLKRTVKQ